MFRPIRSMRALWLAGRQQYACWRCDSCCAVYTWEPRKLHDVFTGQYCSCMAPSVELAGQIDGCHWRIIVFFVRYIGTSRMAGVRDILV